MVDGKIDIATGMSRHSKSWKNIKILWSDLADKLLTEHKTREKFSEYISASKDDQLKIKDVGGFVGGYLSKGRRKPENVLHRQLIALDIDNAHPSFWDDFIMLFDNAAVLHGTHKHTDSDPRYRLVMPLSRECSRDEYQAVSRYVAGMVGIDLFDNTGFQSERLMFWPSTSIDSKYYAVSQDGPWLDVDEVLDTYVDWTDSSAWPTSQAFIKAVNDASKKQQDPEEKRGIIGAFCRTYSIASCIETYLSDEYEDAGEGRYTYKQGTASAGLVTYQDKFAYSHHGTDPSGGQLCNAFDLVRIHKFGHLDNKAAVGGKPRSFQAMEELCLGDKLVKKTIATETFASSKFDFNNDFESLEDDEEPEEKEPVNMEWASELEVDGKGKFVASANNITTIFKHDPALKEAFKENLFDDKKYAMRSLPWRKIKAPEPIKNVDYSGIRNYIESFYGITGTTKIEDALNLEFERHSFHPIKDYLNSLTWDNVPRVDYLLIDYFGADDNLFTREAIRKMLVGAVARIFQPGIKFDLVLTLVGSNQGTGKSTFIKKLGRGWSSDSFHTVNGKEAFEQLQGAWLIELAELSGMRKGDVEAVKHFISKEEDVFRPAYGRIPETFKRKCVFIATTNEKDFLRDPSGNRRFMPVDVVEVRATKDIFSGRLDDDVDQIWAEALTLYRAGEPLYLSARAEKLAKIEQSSHSQTDDRQGLIVQYLERDLPDDWDDLDIYDRRMFLSDPLSPPGENTRDYVCVAEIWAECLGRNIQEMDRYKTRDINDILRGLEDWEQSRSTKNFKHYGKQKYYVRKLN